MSTFDATVDLTPFYLPRHLARIAEPVTAPSGFDWNRWVLPPARFVGGLLLDLATVVVTFAVTLVVASAAVDLYLTWRR